MQLDVIEEDGFKYVDVGEGPTVIFLHGLFGAVSNFRGNFPPLVNDYRVMLPILPLFDLEIRKSTVSGMVDYVERFIEYKKLDQVILMGNSLGGHIALLYALMHPEKMQGLVLTGSSGLFENSLGDTFPRREDYDWVKKKTVETFYDATVVTKDLVDEVYDIVNNREKTIRVISIAKSALRHNLSDKLDGIKVPSLLIWGNDDVVTPPFVGAEFEKLIPDTRLEFIDKCGHAAMMEKPEEFNEILVDFLSQFKS